MEEIDDTDLKAELDEISRIIDDVIKRVAEHEREINGESGEKDQ